MTTRSSISLFLCPAIALFAGATSFAAPAVAQGDLPLTVMPLPGGCPGGPFLTGVATFSAVTLSVTTLPCETSGPAIAVFGFDFQLAPPILLPWGCSGGLCELKVMPAFTVVNFGSAPAPISYTLGVPAIVLGPVYAQAAILGTQLSLANPVVIQ